ncbi:MAG TPA: hypothetical protein VM513_32515 [Kofleriaceae bacterium]|jgi:hypothetical protein|nr:hypothetical protein [Kofleriaceae bacterium]
MPLVRPFRTDDLDQVARLHLEVFRSDRGAALVPAYKAHLHDKFLTGPRPDSQMSSLVSEEPDGTLVGFLGVVPVRMAFGARSLWAAVCTHFCVAPKKRGPTGLQLLRHHFAGPQELSITDSANEAARRVWSHAGGEAVTSCSLYFMRPLRPAEWVLSLAARRAAPERVAQRLSSFGRPVDWLLTRVPQSHFHQPPPSTHGEPLDTSTMATTFPELARERRLVPIYEPATLAWYLERAPRLGPLESALVRDAKGKVLGWYIYCRTRDRTAELLQFVASPPAAGQVLDHLMHEAWRAGMTALCGRIDPALSQPYSDRYCLFSRRGPWLLAHARDPELVHAFHRGEAMFSRLDGEWCAQFNQPAA